MDSFSWPHGMRLRNGWIRTSVLVTDIQNAGKHLKAYEPQVLVVDLCLILVGAVLCSSCIWCDLLVFFIWLGPCTLLQNFNVLMKLTASQGFSLAGAVILPRGAPSTILPLFLHRKFGIAAPSDAFSAPPFCHVGDTRSKHV